MILTRPSEPIFFEPVKPANITTAESFSSPRRTELVRPAWDMLREASDYEVAEEARKILLIIHQTIITFEQLGYNSIDFPPIRAFNLDDGAVVFEWIFTDFRVGFSIEPGLVDSGWYLVSKENLGAIRASGLISNANIRQLVPWLLNFILLFANAD
jgi:hypothetical protein